MTAAATVDVRYLGGCTMSIDGVPAAATTRRTAALLAYITCAGRPLQRASLATLFWPDRDGPAALANLRVLLSYIRRDAPGLVDIDRTTVRLVPTAADQVDVARFEANASEGLARARVGASDAGGYLQSALAEYRGDFLAGFTVSIGEDFDEWQLAEASRLRILLIKVMEALIDADLASGADRDTLALADRLLAIEPYREVAITRAILVARDLNDRAGALQRFDAWAGRLRSEFGIDPSAELIDLVESIRAGARPTTPVAVGPSLPGSEPLIGRDDEVSRIGKSIADGNRLVTITGPAGVGKTSVAVDVARRTVERAVSSVVYLDLVDVTTREALLAALSSATRSMSNDAEESRLSARLAGRASLLVLDNFEHLLSERAVIAELLAAGQDIAVLVTSRSPLRLRGEHVVELPPLDLPLDPFPSHTDLASSGAVRLLLARADRVGSPIAPSLDALRLAGQVCHSVDAIPLAIELAAARLPMFGLAGLADALASSDGRRQLDVLARGPDDSEERHRSVRRALGWSYDQLSSAAQVLFRRLATFSGSFDLDAVTGVCPDTALPEDELIDALAELIDFHLVARVPGRPKARFNLLVAMRAFAQEKLKAAGESERQAARHARCMADRVALGHDSHDEAWEPSVRRFRDDHPNLVSAISWFHGRGDQHQALCMMSRLGQVWRIGAAAPQGLHLFNLVLDDADSEVDPLTLAECRIYRAGLEAERRGAEAARSVVATLDECVPTIQAATAPGRAARCLTEAVHAALVVGDLDRVASLRDWFATSASTEADRWWHAAATLEFAVVAHLTGDDDRAIEILADVVAEARAIGNERIELEAWMWADIIGADREAMPIDPPSLDDLLAMAEAADDQRCAVWILMSLAVTALLDGHVVEAAARSDEAMTIARASDYRHGVGFARMGAAVIAVLSGDLVAAGRFRGALESELVDLQPVMPRQYFDTYLAFVSPLDDILADNPDLAEAIASGRRLRVHAAVAEAHQYLKARITRSSSESSNDIAQI